MFRRLTARASVLAPLVLLATVTSGCSDSMLPNDLSGPGTGSALSNEDSAFRRDGTGKSRPGEGNVPTTLELTPASVSIAVSGAADLTAVLRSRNGHPAQRSVTWHSTDATVASVEGGRIRAVKVGTALVIASADGISDTATVTVTETAAPVDSVIVSPDTAIVVVGQTLALDARPVDSAGVRVASRTITWTTSNSAVAMIEAGKVTGVEAGRAILKASADGETTEVPVTVAEAPEVPVGTVTVTPSPATVREGATVQLTAAAQDADGGVLSGRTVTWATSNEGVAKVSSTGLVSGVGAGSASITATSEGKSGTSTVEVTPSAVAVASVTMSRTAVAIEAGATLQLVATAKDAAGNTLAGRQIGWASSAPAAASVSSSGLVRGVGAGTASITATIDGKAGTTAVTVTAPAPLPQPEPNPTPDPEPAPTPAERVGYYVAPNGSSGGSGSKSSPWDLTSVLRGGKPVAAGDTVWVRGGTYRGEFISYLNGASGRLIVVRAYPGERATIDGNLAITGSYSAFWGLEVMNSNPNRFGGGSGRNGVNVRAPGSKLINMVVHDIGHVGIGTWREAPNSEIYGNIVYNVGYQGPDRGHGHSLYIQNLDGTKYARDNVMFNSFGYGIHAYTSSGQYTRNIAFEGNAVFNSGTLAEGSARPDYMIGGADAAAGISYRGNFSWRNDAGLTGDLSYGSTHNQDLTYISNYFVGSVNLETSQWSSVNQSGNTVLSPSSSTSTRVVVRPNAYEAGRANIIVYNWSSAGAVDADLSNVLRPGDSYEVRNVQDFFGTPVVTGTFGGGSITIPINAVGAPNVIGGSGRTPVSTGTRFNVYVVLKR